MTQGLTQAIGVFLADIVAHGVPEEVRASAKDGFIDCIGCVIAGSREEAVQVLGKAMAPLPPGRSQLWFSGPATTAVEAALLNGVAAHVLDFDDTCLRGHPSAVLVPAIVSLGQELGCSGAQMLDAYVAGYEVWAELVDREHGFHQMKGWHPTGIFGSIATAAACSVLYQLDRVRSAHALGLGASQSAGLMSNFGAMSKSFHAGRAAQAGVVAARLAFHGFTASEDAIEHPRGFLMAVSPSGDVEREQPSTKLGREWQILQRRVNLKKYPTCYYTHRSLDALLDLLKENPVAPDCVVHVDVRLSEEHALSLRNHAPRTGLAAKFSIQFAMACALVARKVGLQELTDAFVMRADVQSLLSRVQVTLCDRYDPQTPGAAWADQVTLHLADGTVLRSADVQHARGHVQLPLDPSDLRQKFMDCLAYGHYLGDANAFFDQLSGLEKQASLWPIHGSGQKR